MRRMISLSPYAYGEVNENSTVILDRDLEDGLYLVNYDEEYCRSILLRIKNGKGQSACILDEEDAPGYIFVSGELNKIECGCYIPEETTVEVIRIA